MPQQAPITFVPAAEILWDVAIESNIAGPQSAGQLLATTVLGGLRRGLYRFQATSSCSLVSGFSAPLVRLAFISGANTKAFRRQYCNDSTPFIVDGIFECIDPVNDTLTLAIDPTSVALGAGERITAHICMTFLGNR